MQKLIRVLFTIMFGAALWGGVVSGVASAAEPYDTALLTLINQARQNPLAAAAAMGMNPERILQDFPELRKILLEGLPPLAFNASLAEAARAHTQDMLAQGYYSHDSRDGRGYDARIRASWDLAGATGESLGMLFFDNFINPTDAVRVMFQYMLWDELSPARTEKRNILNPDLQEAGVSVDTGVFALGGVPRNVYEATVAFGTAITVSEAALLQLINQARANPLGTAQALGIDTAAYLALHPELQAALEQGLAPLAVNGALLSAAREHARDMMANSYYGSTAPDGRTYQERMAASGYQFAAAGEQLGITWQFTAPVDPTTAAARILERMLRDEFDPANAGLTILNPQMQEMGIAVTQGAFRTGQWEGEAYLAVCDVALPALPAPSGDGGGQLW